MLRRISLFLKIFVLSFSLSFLPQAVGAYEEAPVVSGGVLSGKVSLNGTPPSPRIFHLIFSPNIEFCSRISDGQGNRLLRDFAVSDDGGFKDVVVAIVGVESGKPFDYQPEIKIENCRMTPFVAPVRNNHPIHMENTDPVSHNIQSYTLKEEYTFAMFNKPMIPESSTSKKVKLRKGHYLFRTQCGVHDFMQTWGIAVGNPYFAVTGGDGRFEIGDIPPGEYHVIAWHPHMDVQSEKIVIPPDGEATLDFTFEAEGVKIPLHDQQKGYRLQTWLQPKHLAIEP
ncbi:MAG TPA: carboxypeptidase-like regulatory domain-containing protein, partial [Nitrospiria bacterium]|nr:carboxypeptidase-like regulatory domain-containing protein [Nitrospiria bacterium]